MTLLPEHAHSLVIERLRCLAAQPQVSQVQAFQHLAVIGGHCNWLSPVYSGAPAFQHLAVTESFGSKLKPDSAPRGYVRSEYNDRHLRMRGQSEALRSRVKQANKEKPVLLTNKPLTNIVEATITPQGRLI